MSLLEQIRKDVRHMISNRNDFGITITLSYPTKDFQICVTGTAKKHHTTFDELGNVTNTMNATATVYEADLVQRGYITRNDADEITLRNHHVSFSDAQGIVHCYVVTECIPDDHLGVIVLRLKRP